MTTSRSRWHLAWLMIASTVIGPEWAWAQKVPDAGKLLQEFQPPLLPGMPSTAPGQHKEDLPYPLEPKASLTVTLTQITVAGNHLFTADELAPAFKDFLNTPLDFDGLQEVAAALSTFYRQHGLFARAYLPEQDIKDGHLIIQVIEGRYGGMRWDGDKPSHVDSEVIESYLNHSQQEGEAVRVDQIDRSLMLLEDLPGVKTHGVLAPGDKPGDVVLKMRAEDTHLVSGSLSLDDFGSRSTGYYRAGGSVMINSPAHRGDQLSLITSDSLGSTYLKMAYATPVGYDGVQVGLSTSLLDYWLGMQYAGNHNYGNSLDININASYPILKNKAYGVFIISNSDFKFFKNYLGAALYSDYEIYNGSLALYGFASDSFKGGGYTTFNLASTFGNADLSNSPNAASDLTGAHVAGNYAKIAGSTSRTQKLTHDVSFFGSFNGQLANRNLDSSERLSLGGISGVRAFPTGEASGSEGWITSAELRWAALEKLEMSTFFDHGYIRLYHDSNFSGAPTINNYALNGVGVSASWSVLDAVMMKLSLARRVGGNPGADSNGDDNDGGSRRYLVWGTMEMKF